MNPLLVSALADDDAGLGRQGDVWDPRRGIALGCATPTVSALVRRRHARSAEGTPAVTAPG